MQRNLSLDVIRTLAIVLMVIFHFIYDLKFYGFNDWDIPDGTGWKHFRWVIISLFFLSLGASLTLAYQNGFRPKKFFIRVSQIVLCALAISIATYLTIPQNWIFFGVLHFLAIASILVVGFVKHPILCALIGVGFFAANWIFSIPNRWPIGVIFDNLPSYTNDFVDPFPWFGMVFFGVSMAHTHLFRSDPLRQWMVSNSKFSKHITWPGRHSLSIYMVHQPIMLGILYFFT